jgi:hypothetical protein
MTTSVFALIIAAKRFWFDPDNVNRNPEVKILMLRRITELLALRVLHQDARLWILVCIYAGSAFSS